MMRHITLTSSEAWQMILAEHSSARAGNEGNIYRDLDYRASYANIFEDDWIKSIDKSLWGVNKDQVKVCRGCEFRYMCQDTSILIKYSGDVLWEREQTCNYDPNTNEWCKNTI